MTYETGIDENKDKHCDRCGWFVNPYDRHQARPVMLPASEILDPKWLDMDWHLERISAVEFAEEFIKDNPYSEPNYDKNDFAAILEYSKNKKSGISCAVIQRYLRYGIVTPGYSEKEICAAIIKMELCICRFEVAKTITLYRGMSFEPGDPYLAALDGAYEAWRKTGKPVKMVEKGFLSLTRSAETMHKYADGGNGGKHHVYIAATLDKGTCATPLSEAMGTAANGIDKEVLLPSGTEYHIIDMKKIPNGDGTYDYRMHILITDRRMGE